MWHMTHSLRRLSSSQDIQVGPWKSGNNLIPLIDETENSCNIVIIIIIIHF